MLLLIFIAGAATAQKIPDYGFNKIRIVLSDRTIQAELLPLKSDPIAETDKLYYWTGSNTVHTTQGGFSGKLLNGNYTEFYLNKGIKEQGRFKAGLKDGVWKSWNEKGLLIKVYSWDEGVRSGKFELFDSGGKLKQAGYYKNGLLHGEFTAYTADGKAEAVYYKEGTMTEKRHASFLNKINVFKLFKKDSTDKSQSIRPKQ